MSLGRTIFVGWQSDYATVWKILASISDRHEIFTLLRTNKQTAQGLPIPYTMPTANHFIGGLSGREMKLSSHFHLVLKFITFGDVSPFPPYAFMARTGTNLPFTKKILSKKKYRNFGVKPGGIHTNNFQKLGTKHSDVKHFTLTSPYTWH